MGHRLAELLEEARRELAAHQDGCAGTGRRPRPQTEALLRRIDRALVEGRRRQRAPQGGPPAAGAQAPVPGPGAGAPPASRAALRAVR